MPKKTWKCSFDTMASIDRMNRKKDKGSMLEGFEWMYRSSPSFRKVFDDFSEEEKLKRAQQKNTG